MKQGAFTERLARCVEEERLLRGGERLLLAVSGGADSVLLLREMLFLKERFSLTLFVAHVEHGIRGEESLRDAAFVRELAERFGLPFSLLSVDAPALAASRKLSLEEAARTLRYEALTGEARRLACAAVVTAHHAQDQAETVLLRLFRGTGPAGLGGMAPSRELTEDIRLIRPLLWAQPEEIREELRRLEQPWQEDSTNRDESYRRNYLRQNILPHLKGIFPECVDHIDETAEDMRKIYSYFREMIRPLLSEAADGPLDAQALLALPAPAVPLCQRIPLLPVCCCRRAVLPL